MIFVQPLYCASLMLEWDVQRTRLLKLWMTLLPGCGGQQHSFNSDSSLAFTGIAWKGQEELSSFTSRSGLEMWSCPPDGCWQAPVCCVKLCFKDDVFCPWRWEVWSLRMGGRAKHRFSCEYFPPVWEYGDGQLWTRKTGVKRPASWPVWCFWMVHLSWGIRQKSSRALISLGD